MLNHESPVDVDKRTTHSFRKDLDPTRVCLPFLRMRIGRTAACQPGSPVQHVGGVGTFQSPRCASPLLRCASPLLLPLAKSRGASRQLYGLSASAPVSAVLLPRQRKAATMLAASGVFAKGLSKTHRQAAVAGGGATPQTTRAAPGTQRPCALIGGGGRGDTGGRGAAGGRGGGLIIPGPGGGRGLRQEEGFRRGGQLYDPTQRSGETSRPLDLVLLFTSP